jgi:hypothetical protein
MAAQQEDGTLVLIPANASGSLQTVSQIDPSNLSAFGTLETAELTPVFQTDFVYGLNTQLWNTAGTSGAGAAVGTDSARLRVQCGTAATSYAFLESRRIIRYRAGQGIVGRFTTAFEGGVANNIQMVGLGDVVSNAILDGYFVGDSGTTFGFFRYLNSTPVFTPATSFNGDTLDGNGASGVTINPAFGNVWMIKYPYLGYGNIGLYVQHPTTSRWILAHTVRYTNTTATLQLTNPNLQVVAFSANNGNTTNRSVFISGVRSHVSSPKWAADRVITGVTTEANALSLRNATTYNGVTNRSLIRLQSLSAASNGTLSANITVRLKIGVTLGGSPSFTPRSGSTADNGVTITSGNSIASFDVAGTTITGGTYIYNLQISQGANGSGNAVVDLTPYEIFVAPAETLTVSVASTNSASIGVSLNWTEDI